MIVLCFQAETLTPLVIAGADNRNPDLQAEGLRPPSLRGAMRWWFRAMTGSVVGAHDNYKTLRGLESEIFGATDQGSSIRIRTCPLESIKLANAYLCMNDQNGKTWMGIARANIQRPSLYPPSEFRLNMQCDEQALPIVLGSLWLLAMLGGVGARSRRGFGSLVLRPEGEVAEKAVQEMPLDFSYPDSSLADLVQFLGRNLQQIHQVFRRYAPNVDSPPVARFPVLSRTQAKLWLIKPQDGFWADWEAAMNDLRDDVYRAYKTSKGLRPPEIGSARPRQASSLIIQIKGTAQDNYFGILLAFDEQFNKQKYLGANWSDFISFLSGLSGYEYREVTLP